MKSASCPLWDVASTGLPSAISVLTDFGLTVADFGFSDLATVGLVRAAVFSAAILSLVSVYSLLSL